MTSFREKTSKRSLLITALSLMFVAVILTFKSSNEPIISFLQNTVLEDILQQCHTGNEIIFNISMGYLVSLMFWVIVVKIPELRRRRIVTNNLSTRYQWFKEDAMRILLTASGEHDVEPKTLCDYKKFKEYFGSNHNENWYKALNGLQANDALLNDMFIEIELLTNEVSYILNKVDIEDDELFGLFKRLSYHVYRLKNSQYYYEDRIKYLSTFLWEIFARWNIIDGQRDVDIIEDAIKQL